MEECKVFTKGSRRYQICIGEADLPIEKINSYRVNWGMQKLENISPVKNSIVFDKTVKVKTIKNITKSNSNPKSPKSCKVNLEPVGTTLKRIIKDLTKIKTSKTCNCNNLAKDMDQGIEWCENNRDYIINHLIKNKDMLLEAFNNAKSDFIINVIKKMGAIQTVKTGFSSLGKLFSGHNINDSIILAGAEFLLNKAIEDTKKNILLQKPKQQEVPTRLINLNYLRKTTNLQDKLYKEAISNINLIEDKFTDSPVFTFGAHLWPVKGLWKMHCDNWNKIAKTINGKTYIVVAIDSTTDDEEYVRNAFDKDIELIFTSNTHSGEVPSFKILLDLIPRGENDVFVYTHSKGVRKHTNSSEAVKLWIEIMYNTVVFNHKSIIKRFEEGYKCFGAFRTFGDQPLEPKYRWHYAGTFFAIRSKYIPKISKVKDVYGGVEAWPGSVFTPKEAWVEFGDNKYVGEQYSSSLMLSDKFQSIYKEWLNANR